MFRSSASFESTDMNGSHKIWIEMFLQINKNALDELNYRNFVKQ